MLLLILVATIFMGYHTGFAEYTIINSEVTKEQLGPGITYEHKIDFTDRGFININVLRMDYDDPYVEMALLKSDESISNRGTLTQFAKKEPSLFGAVNGDFFNYDYHTTIGPMVEDGIVYSSPINDPEFSSFNITKSNQFLIHNWATTFFRLEKQGFKLPIDYVNKPYFDGNKIILFNKNWSTLTRGNTHNADILEMMIVNGEVREITLNGGPKVIPENAYVIAAVGNKINLIQSNFKLFDQVTFVKDDSFDAIDFSIGGGTRLLKNGAVVDDFTLNINGRHPRTAIGYTANREVLLVTVDGRSTSYPGVTQLELANILLDLGATDAINLDGGGSTAMIKKDGQTNQQKVVNQPSDGQQRRVQNAVGFKGSYPVERLETLKLTPIYPRVFANDSIEIQLAAYDKNKNNVSNQIDTNLPVKWAVIKGNGHFVENIYYPTSPGHHIIEATYGEAKGTTTLHVLKDIAELRITPNQLMLKPGATVKLYAEGISTDGYYAPIKQENITWLMTGNTGILSQDGLFTAFENNGSGIIRGSFNDLETFIPVAVGTETRLIHNFEKEIGHFVSYPKEVTGKYSLLKFGEDGSMAGKLEFNFKHTDATRAAYIDFGEAIIMTDIPNKIGLSVFGNYGNNHWLRAKLTDGNGKSFTVDFQQNVSWEGWKTVEAILPKNIVAPVKIQRIYLVETDATLKDSGAIVIDNLTGVFQPTFSGDVPKSINKIAHLEDFVLFDQGNYVINADTFSIDQLMKEQVKNTSILKINNQNNGILKNGYLQWVTLLATLQEEKETPLLLIMASSPDFTDPLEESLFYEKLSLATRSRKIAIVYPNTTNSYRMERGIELLGLNVHDPGNTLSMLLDQHIAFELRKVLAAE